MPNVEITDFCDHEIQLLTATDFNDLNGKRLMTDFLFKISKNSHAETFSCKVTERATDYLGSKKQISDLEAKGVIFNETFSGNKQKMFRNIMLQNYHNIKTEKICFPQGVVTYNETVGCILGNDIIFPAKSSMDIFCSINSYHLHEAHASKLMRMPALPDVIRFCKIDDSVCPLIVMYTAFSVLQGYLPLFGIKERFMLILEGKTSTFKSTLAKIAADIFKENTVLTLSSTQAAIQELLSSIGNVPIVLDDYNKSSFSAPVREKGKILSEIIQAYPERNDIKKMAGRQVSSYQIKCGIIVTAEELMKNPSTLNRCLIASLKEDIHPKMLEAFQRDGTHVFSVFVKELNIYIVNHLLDIKDSFLTNYYNYRDNHNNMPYEPSTVPGYYRINTTFSLSMATVDVIQYFLKYKNIGKRNIENLCKSMSAAINVSCRSLCERLCSHKIRHDHIDIIGIYYDSCIQAECTDSIKKYYDSCKYSGIIKDDILYIRWNNLQKYFEKFGLETTKRAFSDELAFWGLLKLDSDGKRSIHLPGYTTHRERFYGIRIFDLVEKQQEFSEETWNAYYASKN